MTLTENIQRLANGTQAVVIAGRMTELGCKTNEIVVDRWLKGENVPQGDKIPYLAQALGTDPNGLYEGILEPVERH